MQNAPGKQCLIATSLLVVILVATDAKIVREKENEKKIQKAARERGRKRVEDQMNDPRDEERISDSPGRSRALSR